MASADCSDLGRVDGISRIVEQRQPRYARVAAMPSIRAGQQFGNWVTKGERPLGRGGNGEVWHVETADGRLGAIKILFNRRGRVDAYRLGRFKDEISFLISHPDFPGILPLLDNQISENLNHPSWYVMPVATPIRQALGNDPEPVTVVGAVAEIAETLAALQAERVAHRDIKPDNLFRLDDQWVIGDFGLVSYPEKDPRTEHGRRLGPIEFMAPEMREDADRAEPGPADVWALSKTLWVLLTGETFPLPGPHRPGDLAYSLYERIIFSYAGELDLLLERSTRIDSSARESMDDFARELRACLAPLPETLTSSTLPELRDRISALTTFESEKLSAAQQWTQQVAEVYRELEHILNDTSTDLAALLPTFRALGGLSHRLGPGLMDPPNLGAGPEWGRWSQGRMRQSPGEEHKVAVGIQIETRIMRQDGPIEIAVALWVQILGPTDLPLDINEIWNEGYSAPIGSAQLIQVFAAIRAGFHAAFDMALRRVAEILGASS